MTNDELLAAFGELFTELHAKVHALPDSHDKTVAIQLAAMFHHAGNIFAEHVGTMGEIQTFDGTNKPPYP